MWRGTVLAMASLAVASALAVSSLYWAQSVVIQAAQELGPSTFVSMAPSATLLGYALGVAVLATYFHDLSTPRGLALHGTGLAAALSLAAASDRTPDALRSPASRSAQDARSRSAFW